MAVSQTPSKGAKPDKLMRDALIVALKREAVDADGKKTIKLAVIAEKMVDLAAGGDVQAFKDITDRVDGKAIQAITGADGGPLEMRMIDARSELDRKLAGLKPTETG